MSKRRTLKSEKASSSDHFASEADRVPATLHLLRRTQPCKLCGRVHGPPRSRCPDPSSEGNSNLYQASIDDGLLPWLF